MEYTDPLNVGRCCSKDILRTPPGVTSAGRCNTIEESFRFFMTPDMLDLETNCEANRWTREWNEKSARNVPLVRCQCARPTASSRSSVTAVLRHLVLFVDVKSTETSLYKTILLIYRKTLKM